MTIVKPIRAAPSLRGRVEARRLLAVLGLFAGALVYASAFGATYVDDAYIQLRYAQTLLESGTWGFYAGFPANTSTSPLNVLLTAAVGLPLGSVERAVVVLTALELVALLGLLRAISRRLFDRDFFGWFAFVGLAANPLLLSTIGLESVLYAVLLVAAVFLFLVERWVATAVAVGLLTLARPDGVLLLAVLLPLAAAPWRTKARMLLAYGATIAPWFLFSWIALGSLVPDTLVIKLGDQAWGGTNFGDGLALYLDRFPLETAGSLLLAPLCLFPWWQAGRDTLRVATLLALYGGSHYVVYSALAVPPYHWYFTHQVVPLVLLASLAAAHHAARWDGGRTRWLAWAAVVVPAVGLLGLAWDEGFPWREAPINTNWARSAQYREIGRWMDANLAPGEAVAIRGEIGTVAFYSDRYMVNEFSDMSVADRMIADGGYESRPTTGPLWALNFLWRRSHAPLPTPRFEFVPAPELFDGQPRCLPEDPLCRTARDVATEWVGPKRVLVRELPPPPPPA